MQILTKYFTDFTPEQTRQFAELGALYSEWNQKINVVSRKDIEGIYEKHILHSLSIAAAFPFPPGLEIIDIGTGGGFPGVPLAIFFPEVQFHLVDSIGKKLKVIEAIKEATGIKNITTRHARAEEIKDRKFDFAVSRAVAPLKELLGWCRPLLKKGVYEFEEGERERETERERLRYASGLICLKGGDLREEIKESGTRPKMLPVNRIFQEEYFNEKYILYVPMK